MTDSQELDIQRAHEYFSVECFNATWDLIDMTDRTPEDDEAMIRSAHASLWHWSQRADGSDKNLSIGYWQTSRVYALIGDACNARKYAQLCLSKTPEYETFCLGYAFEALARAESLAKNKEQAKEYLAIAFRHADNITSADEKELLINDLKELE